MPRSIIVIIALVFAAIGAAIYLIPGPAAPDLSAAALAVEADEAEMPQVPVKRVAQPSAPPSAAKVDADAGATDDGLPGTLMDDGSLRQDLYDGGPRPLPSLDDLPFDVSELGELKPERIKEKMEPNPKFELSIKRYLAWVRDAAEELEKVNTDCDAAAAVLRDVLPFAQDMDEQIDAPRMGTGGPEKDWRRQMSAAYREYVTAAYIKLADASMPARKLCKQHDEFMKVMGDVF
jgi:hypothetical protein